ncbi:MAG: pre-peptidase C-terminal domain-containing protein, partial [Sulfurovum sp.]|nr:pre-peptidase C-terminal domain-containing protein [Sulfurovum sp.]
MRSYLQWPVATIAIVILSACGNNISVNDGNTTLNSPSTKSSNGNTNAKDNTDTAKGNTNTPRTVLCDIRYQGFRYGCVASSKTNRIWLDRNLGASRAATSLSDEGSYGYHFQWGRPKDGHQGVFSDKTNRRATTIHPSSSAFIAVDNNTTDWVADGVDDNGAQREAFLWKTDGTGICPKGFRVPTIEELFLESSQPHFQSTLNFPLAGFRDGITGDVKQKSGPNAAGYYMASDKFSNKMVRILSFDQNNMRKIETKGRAYGYSVRCIGKRRGESAPVVSSPSESETSSGGTGSGGTGSGGTGTASGGSTSGGSTSGGSTSGGSTSGGTEIASGGSTSGGSTSGGTGASSGGSTSGGTETASGGTGSGGTETTSGGTETASGGTETASGGSTDDHGNSKDEATSISLQSTTEGRINGAGDVDWFKVVISRRGTLTVDTTGSTDTEGFLYNASGTKIASNDDSGSDRNFKILRSVVAGTYYVKVKHHNALLTGSYLLVAHFDDHGNSKDEAAPINPNGETLGSIEMAGDEDWFK